MAWCTYRTEDLVEAPAGKRREKTHPIAAHRFNTAVACMRRGRVGKLVVSLTEGKVNRLDLDLKTGIIIRESELADVLGFQAKAVVVTASCTLLRAGSSFSPKLYSTFLSLRLYHRRR